MSVAIPLAFTGNLTHEQWLAIRMQGIGGSEVSALIGKNPWASPLQVYLDKVGKSAPLEETEPMYFGKKLEAIVADTFSERTGLPVKELRFILQDENYPHLLANVDRVIEHPEWGRGILECKTANAFKLDDWQGGKVPENYYYQVQHYLGVTDYQYGYIACLIGGNTFRYTRIERNEEVIQYLRDAATDFWNTYVIPQIMPEPNHLDRYAITSLYPNHTEENFHHLKGEEYVLIEQLLQARKASKQAKASEELARNRVTSLMGIAEAIYYEGEKMVTWKTNKKMVRVFKVHCDDESEE